jgi:reactive intermediate/imine deaminase
MNADSALGSAERQFVAPTGILAAAPYSAAVQVGDMIILSGQIGLDEAGALIPGVGGQTRACLQSISNILEGLGASLADVVQTRVFLTSFGTYAEYNDAYREFFSAPYPARATLGTSELALGAGIEIEAVAIRRTRDD